MANSYRKTPVIGACADTDKSFKKMRHRQIRRAESMALSRLEEPEPWPPYDHWSSSKDGKLWIGDRFPEEMRK